MIIFSFGLSLRIFNPSTAFVPSSRITIGHFKSFPLVASTIPSATRSHLVIPPNMLMKTLETESSVSRTSHAALTVSAFAPPPMS